MTIGPRVATSGSAESPFTFPERLVGTVRFAGSASADGSGRFAGSAAAALVEHQILLDLTWVIRDLGAFFDDPRHRLLIAGSVTCDALGGELPVTGGHVDLFGSGEDGAVVMQYLIDLTAPSGLLRLGGEKAIVHDSAWDMWADTTTLPVEVRARAPRGEGGELVVAGEVRLSFPEVLRSIVSMRQRGPLRRSVAAVVAFDRFFVSRLAYVYLSPARPGLPRRRGSAGRR